jgi:hypothetical protein
MNTLHLQIVRPSLESETLSLEELVVLVAQPDIRYRLVDAVGLPVKGGIRVLRRGKDLVVVREE